MDEFGFVFGVGPGTEFAPQDFEIHVQIPHGRLERLRKSGLATSP